MDITQIILVVVISVITFMLLVLGFQLFLVLQDLRQSLKRTNKILDETDIIIQSIGEPIINFSQVLTGLRTTSKMLRALFGTVEGKNLTKNITQKGKQTLEKVEELVDKIEFDDEVDDAVQIKRLNGEHEELEVPRPRFFKGIPKRR